MSRAQVNGDRARAPRSEGQGRLPEALWNFAALARSFGDNGCNGNFAYSTRPSLLRKMGVKRSEKVVILAYPTGPSTPDRRAPEPLGARGRRRACPRGGWGSAPASIAARRDERHRWPERKGRRAPRPSGPLRRRRPRRSRPNPTRCESGSTRRCCRLWPTRERHAVRLSRRSDSDALRRRPADEGRPAPRDPLRGGSSRRGGAARVPGPLRFSVGDLAEFSSSLLPNEFSAHYGISTENVVAIDEQIGVGVRIWRAAEAGASGSAGGARSKLVRNVLEYYRMPLSRLGTHQGTTTFSWGNVRDFALEVLQGERVPDNVRRRGGDPPRRRVGYADPSLVDMESATEGGKRLETLESETLESVRGPRSRATRSFWSTRHRSTRACAIRVETSSSCSGRPGAGTAAR